ncbi:MAG: hypothetical protein FWF50_05370 [Defluviitaleaceae bacterium]|nr:hypothetical protein [Defluviitaleaceae bacterium]
MANTKEINIMQRSFLHDLYLVRKNNKEENEILNQLISRIEVAMDIEEIAYVKEKAGA